MFFVFSFLSLFLQEKIVTCKLSLNILFQVFIAAGVEFCRIGVNGFVDYSLIAWGSSCHCLHLGIIFVLYLFFFFFIHFAGQSTDTPCGTGWTGKCSPAFISYWLAMVDHQTLHCPGKEWETGSQRLVQCCLSPRERMALLLVAKEVLKVVGVWTAGLWAPSASLWGFGSSLSDGWNPLSVYHCFL